MAQVDYFLQIDGIKGESTEDKHKGEIDLQSWSWGETNSGSMGHGGGGGTGRVVMQDFQFVAQMSKATPALMLACAQGKHIEHATLTCYKAGGDKQEYLKIKLSELVVSSYQTGGGPGAGSVLPTEHFSLNFSKIEYEYKPQKTGGGGDGPVKAGYDLRLGTKV